MVAFFAGLPVAASGVSCTLGLGLKWPSACLWTLSPIPLPKCPSSTYSRTCSRILCASSPRVYLNDVDNTYPSPPQKNVLEMKFLVPMQLSLVWLCHQRLGGNLLPGNSLLLSTHHTITAPNKIRSALFLNKRSAF
jgi:hypothetical protein